MPILPAEPFLYPEHLFQETEANPREWERWWVIHTRPRAEKSLARESSQEEIPFFLPQYTLHWRTNGRLFKATHPIFPGYFFFRGEDEARAKLQSTAWVANMLFVNDQKTLHADLARIHRLITTGLPLTPESRLVPGSRVAITGGPLRGLEGTILRQGTQFRLVLEVRFMRQGVSVEVENWMVSPLAPQKERHASKVGVLT
jgi:hypothetical protein